MSYIPETEPINVRLTIQDRYDPCENCPNRKDGLTVCHCTLPNHATY